MRKKVVERPRIRSGWGRLLVGAVVVCVGSVVVSASAGADEPSASEVKAGESEPCPYLTEARYPFLKCGKDAFGNVVLEAPVQEITGLRIPEMDAFIEGPGYWGS